MSDLSVLRFAILGCGRMGRMHIERLIADGRGRAVALFDTQPDAVESLRRELAPAATGFTSFDELLTQTDADAAIIGTPTSLHFEHIRACRARGWHVLCEKPLADRREHLLSLIDEARSGPALSVAYQRRTWPVYRVLRDELQSGRWGAVRAVTSINSERWQQTIGGTWRDDPAINLGGFLGDAGSHKIDLAFFLTGLNPLDVFARNQTCGNRVEIVSSLSARLERDVLLTMHFTGNAQTFREDFHFHCEHADLLVRDWQIWLGRNNTLEPLKVAEPRLQAAMGVSPLTHPELDRLGNPVSGFLDQLLLGAPPVAPPECALPVFDFTQAALRSGRSGRVEFVV
ncbi:MAG: oxidoreductase [Planctomycetota bacterium]|nr:MAG: oxidoreductase [Planctomycetota bacterium]